MNQRIDIVPTSEQRVLPDHILGLNCPVPWDVPHEDPALVEPLRQLAPGLLRFPGGTVANFFDWRSGQLAIEEVPDESTYRRYVRSRLETSRSAHPAGAHLEEFSELARAVGAEVILVANLETSSVDEQVAWLEHLRSIDLLPRRIELGNEFYHALLGDPTSQARFPNWTETTAISKEYAAAFRAVAPQDTMLAAQSASSRFHAKQYESTDGRHRHGWTWDDDMQPEAWFDAVTIHPYPSTDGVLEEGAALRYPTNGPQALVALLARCESGLSRCIEFTRSKLPGKEIWISEWGVGEISWIMDKREAPSFDGMWAHVLTRYLITALRYREVSVMTAHGMYANGGLWAPFRRRPGGGFDPSGPYTVFRWFFEAANRGASHRAVDVLGQRDVPGRGIESNESFKDVDAVLFERGNETILLVQNAGDESVKVNVEGFGLAEPTSVEALVPDLFSPNSESLHVPVVLQPAQNQEIPPWSITRFSWVA